MHRNTHLQDSWLADPSSKLLVRKSGDKTTFCSYCQKKIDMTNDGESPLKRHTGLVPSENKGKNHNLIPVAGSGSRLDYLKKPENEEVTNDSRKKKNNSTINSQSIQLPITVVLE